MRGEGLADLPLGNCLRQGGEAEASSRRCVAAVPRAKFNLSARALKLRVTAAARMKFNLHADAAAVVRQRDAAAAALHNPRAASPPPKQSVYRTDKSRHLDRRRKGLQALAGKIKE